MKSHEPNAANGGSNKPPPYPVEPSTLIDKVPKPDRATADIVSAVQWGFYDRVTELIEANPQLVTATGSDNISLLHWAAINNHVDVAKYLINKGAKIDACGGALNATPLNWAVRDAKLETVVLLLSHGAQTSSLDNEGLACIHVAAGLGHTAIVAYLVAKGVDVNLVDRDGLTPLMHAANRVRNRDPTQLLIRLGALVNYQNPNNNFTALHYAINGNNYEAVRLLLESGAKTHLRDSDDQDAFDCASKSQTTNHLLFLLYENSVRNPFLPRWLQAGPEIRRLGTKLFPYIILILIPLILQMPLWFLYKGVAFIAIFFCARFYILVFFDRDVHRNLPIAIAQASIFWLYVCYAYYFLPYIQVASFTFVALVIFTYFSWTNYYYAQKADPGFLVSNSEQQHRTIIQLVEQNLFNDEHFCTWCLLRRPLRSKHCRDCQKCVSRFDHHCPWVDNCVGDKTLSYFFGFVFFTPICLCFFLHGAYVYFRFHCYISWATIGDILTCQPLVLWFTIIAFMHCLWITGLCITVFVQVVAGFTTNERLNFFRYKYLISPTKTPFTFGWKQNLVDLINRRILWCTPTNFDWSRIYTVDDFNETIPARLRRPKNSFNV